jgi:hypothetical protein
VVGGAPSVRLEGKIAEVLASRIMNAEVTAFLRRAPQPAAHRRPLGWRAAEDEQLAPEIHVLPPPAAVLDADPLEPARVSPGAELGAGGCQVGRVAEHVAQAVAPSDAKVGRVGVGDVVVEPDQRSHPSRSDSTVAPQGTYGAAVLVAGHTDSDGLLSSWGMRSMGRRRRSMGRRPWRPKDPPGDEGGSFAALRMTSGSWRTVRVRVADHQMVDACPPPGRASSPGRELAPLTGYQPQCETSSASSGSPQTPSR